MKIVLIMCVCVGLAAAAAYHDHDHDHDHHDHHDYHKDRHEYKDQKDYERHDHDHDYYDHKKKDHDHDHYDHDHYDHKKKDHDHDHYDHDHYDHKKKDHDRDHYDHDHDHDHDHYDHKKKDHDHDHDHHYHYDDHHDKRQGREETFGQLKDMITEGIIPDVIKNLPRKPLSVKFNDLEVQFGNELTPTEVKYQPNITWESEKDSFYTLSMVDPDVPSRKEPTLREANHWLLVNIHGSDLSSGETIAAFISSGPPKDTDYHRYVFLLYKQPKKIEWDEKKIPEWRLENRFNFSISKFSEKYQLGDALAGNFYKAKWDPYVEEYNKKITKLK